MYQSQNFATSSKFRAAMSLLWSSCSIVHFLSRIASHREATAVVISSSENTILHFQPATHFCWQLFILPDGDTDSAWFHDEVSRPGIWNDLPDAVIGVSMLSSEDEYISRTKNDFLVRPESLKSSELEDRILPKAY